MRKKENKTTAWQTHVTPHLLLKFEIKNKSQS